MQPAELAGDVSCADVMVRLPDSLAGASRVWTDAQATAAWGEPASILLTCGLPEQAPTELPCQSVGGVDWVIDESEAPRYRITSFGREPSVELYLDNEDVSSFDVLESLSPGIDEALPETGAVCTERPTG